MPPDETSSATGPHHFQMGSWIDCAPFEKLLQIEILEAAEGRALLRMPFLLDYAQGAGLMHGGALVSLADTALVMAIKSIVPPLTHFATVTMTAEYLRPVRKGVVTARSQVTSLEGRELEGQTRVYDYQQRPVLDFRACFKIARDARIRNMAFDEAPIQSEP